MQPSMTTPVHEVLVQPYMRTVLEILGVDTCCGADRSLKDASADAALSPAELLGLLATPAALPEGNTGRLPEDSSLAGIVDWVGGRIHPRARRFLIALIIRARSLSSSHGRRLRELWQTRDQLEELARDLIPHMSTEERYLFPYIRSMTETMRADATLVVPLLGTIEFPLQAIKHDHAADMNAIAALRQSTRDFTPDERSCAALREFYRALALFARELQEHIHLENDVLFPQAVEMEKRVARA